MYITQTDIINMRSAIDGRRRMSDGEILSELINEDKQSDEFKKAKTGLRYYAGEHDVLKKDFTSETVEVTATDKDGEEYPRLDEFKNPNRSNYRTSHPFLHNHVVQKISYILGKEPSITVNSSGSDTLAQKYQEALAKTTDAMFNNALSSLATAASVQGRAWLHEFKDKQGVLRQAVVARVNGIPIYDMDYEQTLEQFIYHYEMIVRTGRDTTVKRICAQWWDADGVTYWISDDGAVFKPDPDRPGKQPHYWEVTYSTAKDGVTQIEKKRIGKVWGRVPFAELRNNDEGSTDLERYKDLIDAHDVISSEGTNNLLDFTEFWAVIQGFGGDLASSVVRKLKINHAISINSQGGSVDMNQLSLDMKGRIDWLKVLRESIHEFGMAVDINNDRFGNAPSGVALKFQYTLLDLKANRLIAKLRQTLQFHFWFITQEINRRDGSKYDSADINVGFNKSMITNDTELVNMIVVSRGLVPDRMLVAAHPLVDDPDAAMTEMEEQRKKEDESARNSLPTYGVSPGDDET